MADAHKQMEQLNDEGLTLARAGEIIGSTTGVKLTVLARLSWQTVEIKHARFAIETDATIEADEHRLCQLLENLFRNVIEHDGDDVTIRVADTADGFVVADDRLGFDASFDIQSIHDSRTIA